MTSGRERLGLLTGAVIAILVFGLMGSWRPSSAGVPAELATAGLAPQAEDTALGEDVNQERGEQSDAVQERVDAWSAAQRAGTAGQSGRRAYLTGAAARATSGWVGETPIDPVADDWEPAIAADPHSPYVYVLTTRYGTSKPCPGNCPTPWISLTISSDGGATLGASKPLCACKGSGQFDPIIEVVPATGAVYSCS